MNNQVERAHSKTRIFARLLPAYLVVLAWTLFLMCRLVYLQVVLSGDYQTRARQQQEGFIELRAQRGDILDRHLDELATGVQTESVFAQPDDLKNPYETADRLAPVLGQPAGQIYRKLVSGRSFVYLARKISPRTAAQVRELKQPGIYLHDESMRVYPNRELAAHLLGFVGLDNTGLSGLEYLYDEELKGKKRRVNLRMDARRNSYERESVAGETKGNVLVLTIDRNLQFIAEQVLRQTVEKSGALNGSAVLMNPNTGEILALASYPSFNPNIFAGSDGEARRNRAILEIFEPGSTFKIITLASVLNEGLADPGELIDCTVGTLRIAGKVYREDKHSYGTLTFQQVLAKSSNVGTIKFGLRLGEEKLYEYIRRFGFGEKTGVDLPGEQSGLLRPPAQWSRISIGALSIGQEIGVTPLQMTRAVSVIASGGYRVRPYVVSRILTPAGDVVREFEPERVRVLDPGSVKKMFEALRMVVDQGTGRTARLNGYTSAGKTGTAQKFIDGRYSRTKFVASYVGFGPLAAPALAAIVVVNEPRTSIYGSQIAAPAFKEIMERALIHLRVPQDALPEPRLEVAELRPSRPAGRPGPEPDPPADISVMEESMEADGLEETVLNLLEQQPLDSPVEGKVTVDLNSLALPDFSGMSLRDVARECARRSLKLKAAGSGVAVGQRPPPGNTVSEGTICEVFFSRNGQKVNAAGQIAFQTARIGEVSGGNH